MTTVEKNNTIQKNRWHMLKERMRDTNTFVDAIDAIDNIDRSTMFEPVEPAWWLDMMSVRKRLQDQLNQDKAIQAAQRHFATFDESTGHCVKYNQFLLSKTEQEHLTALENNFERAFNDIPDANEMRASNEFVYFFLSEIVETNPTSVFGNAAAKLKEIIDQDDFVNTCRKIAAIST